MSLHSVLSATGIAAVLYSAYRLAAFMNVYLRPSSLEKYLSNGTYAVVTGATDGIGKAVEEGLISFYMAGIMKSWML
jgi:hypothetical protein